MNLSLMLPEEARILISHAQKRGKDLETYLSELIGSQNRRSFAIRRNSRSRAWSRNKGTRITVYDVLDYQLLGWQPEAIAVYLRVTPAQVEKALVHRHK